MHYNEARLESLQNHRDALGSRAAPGQSVNRMCCGWSSLALYRDFISMHIEFLLVPMYIAKLSLLIVYVFLVLLFTSLCIVGKGP